MKKPIFLGFFALVTLFPASSFAVLVDYIAANVNADPILNSQIQNFAKTLPLRSQLDPLFGYNESIQRGNPTRSDILETLIQEHLIGEQFKVEDKEVESEIDIIQQNNSREGQVLTRETLIGFLNEKGFTFAEYFELLRNGLQKRQLLKKELEQRVNISEDDIRNHYYNTIKRAKTKVSLEYSMQILSIDSLSFKETKFAEQAAKQALKMIRQGMSFADAAASTPGASTNTDATSYVSRDQLGEGLSNAVEKLQIGEVSEVAKNGTNFIIVKLVDVLSKDATVNETEKNRIRFELAQQESKKQLQLWAERARNEAFVQINPAPSL